MRNDTNKTANNPTRKERRVRRRRQQQQQALFRLDQRARLIEKEAK